MDKPDFATQGDEFLKNGQFLQAEKAYRLAVKKTPRIEAWVNLGHSFLFQGKIKDAEAAFAEALEINEKSAEALLGMATTVTAQGQDLLGIGYLALAARSAPDDPVYKQTFLDIGGRTTFLQHNPEAADILVECFRTPELSFRNAQILWSTLLLSQPAFREIYEMGNLSEESFDTAPLLSPLFIEGLKKMVVNSLEFEAFIGRLRHWLLMGLSASRDILPEKDYIRLADALAAYCYATDYIIAGTAEEKTHLQALEKQIQEEGKADAASLCIYACYKPITSVLTSDMASPRLEKGSAVEKIRHETLQITPLKKNLVREGKITDSTSIRVQEQYEEFPYPRWDRIPVTIKNKIPVPLAHKKKQLADTPPRILIAGGGTGWKPLLVATQFPAADITAIDLSLSSLAYARMKAEEHGISNVAFRQMDILDLKNIPDTYNMISSSGVLHHMKDPMAGWKMLCDKLEPGGFLRLGLYSKTARRSIEDARKKIVQQNIHRERDSMLAFRQNIASHLGEETAGYLQKHTDYYNMSTFRDLVFHVQEYCFTLPEIGEALSGFGLTFLGFEIGDNTLSDYRKSYPDDPQALTLKNWHAFELKNPDIFANMYQFWCEKK